MRGSAGQDKAFSRSITSTRVERQTGDGGGVVAGWQHCQAGASQSVNYVFPPVSQPYLPIFRGYLHGLWAG